MKKRFLKTKLGKKTIQRCEDEDHEDHSPKGKKEVQKSPLIYIILN